MSIVKTMYGYKSTIHEINKYESVCMYIDVYIYVYTHICMYICISISVCTYIYAYELTYAKHVAL